jgi:hypothetical protein
MSKKQKARRAREAPSREVRFGEGEQADLRLVLLAIVVPMLVWSMVLGWSWGDLLGAHDNALAVLQMKLVSEAGGWRGALYQWWGFGGGELLSVTGFPPINSLFLLLGLTPVSIVTAFNLFTHFGSAFLGARAALELACWTSTDPARVRAIRTFSWFRETALVLLFGFLPILAWRIPFGHQLILIGNWALLGWILTFTAGMQRSLSFTLLGIIALLDLHVFPVLAQQTLIYSVVFGSPVVGAIYWRARRTDASLANRQFLFSTLLPVLALLVSLPVLQHLIRFMTGTEAMRGTSSGPVIYGYIVSQLRDWWSSIPWAREAIPFGREFGLHHEVNYAIGPLLLAFLFLARSRALLVAIIVSAIAIIGLASQWPGISDALLATVPILKSFRVPARAFVLTTWLVTIIGTALLLADLATQQTRQWTGKDLLWPAGVIGLMIIAASSGDEAALGREVVSWGMIGFLVFQLWQRRRIGANSAVVFPGWVVLFLAVAAVTGFKDRGSYVVRHRDAWETPLRIRDEVWSQASETRHPLNRIFLATETPMYIVNTGSVAGLGQIAGYFAGPKRFFYLLFGLRAGQIPDPAVSVSRISPADPEFGILSALYNIRYLVNEEGGRRFVTANPGALDYEFAPAWLSRQARVLGDWPDLWRELRSTHAAGAYRWKNVMSQETWILSQDQAKTPLVQDCRFERPQVELGSPELLPRETSVRVSGFEGRCPLTVSMNYSPSLRVYAGDVELKTFPAYGALLGVSVSADEAKSPIRIVSRVEVPFWAWHAQLLGGVGLLAVIWTSVRGARRESGPGMTTD